MAINTAVHSASGMNAESKHYCQLIALSDENQDNSKDCHCFLSFTNSEGQVRRPLLSTKL